MADKERSFGARIAEMHVLAQTLATASEFLAAEAKRMEAVQSRFEARRESRKTKAGR